MSTTRSRIVMARQLAQAILNCKNDSLWDDCENAVTTAMNEYNTMHKNMAQCLREDDADDGFEDELLALIDQFALAVQRTASYDFSRLQ
jgi:hypothetical protein